MEELLEVLRRWRHGIVTLVLVASAVRQGFGEIGDWPTVKDGVNVLFGVDRRWLTQPGGLSLYANYPEIQFGPLSLLVGAPFVALGDAGRVLLGVALLAAGLAIYWAVDAMAGADDDPATALQSMIGGVMFAAAWPPLASGYYHVDDAIAVGACVAAVAAMRRGGVVTAGVLVGVATAAKPWALVFLPLLWAGGRREAWRGVIAAGIVTALAWGPFVVGDTATLGAGQPTVDVSAASVLHLFGASLGLAPSWVRAPQLLLALALAAIAVRRGHWYAAPLVALAARVAVDPGTFSYYTSGAVAAALLRDLLSTTQRLPWATTIAFVTLNLPDVALADHPRAQASLRLVGCAGLVILGLVGSDADRSTPKVRTDGHLADRVRPARGKP